MALSVNPFKQCRGLTRLYTLPLVVMSETASEYPETTSGAIKEAFEMPEMWLGLSLITVAYPLLNHSTFQMTTLSLLVLGYIITSIEREK